MVTARVVAQNLCPVGIKKTYAELYIIARLDLFSL